MKMFPFPIEFRLFVLVKNLKLKDETLLRQEIYNQLIQNNYKYKFLNYLYKYSPHTLRVTYLLLFCSMSLGKIPQLKNTKATIIGLVESIPEKLATESICDDSNFEIIFSKFKVSVFLSQLKTLTYTKIIRYIKFISFISQRNSLLITARTGQLLIYCNQNIHSNQTSDTIKNFIVSSDASPSSYGLFYLLRADQYISYVPHGIIPYSKHLILFQKVFYKTMYNYMRMKKRTISKAIYSIDNENKAITFSKLDKKEVSVGIVGSIIPNQLNIQKIINEIYEERVTIFFKKHPNQIPRKLKLKNIQTTENIEGCDIVLCGNSGHAIKLLQKKIPVLYCSGLDNAPNDIYGLVRDGILLDYSFFRSFDKIINYYNSEEWGRKWNLI